jgi:hypothetical protein
MAFLRIAPVVAVAGVAAAACDVTLYPTSCGYDRFAPSPTLRCEGTVLVRVQEPCIDDRNRNDPPPATVTPVADCAETGGICDTAHGAACERTCTTDADCARRDSWCNPLRRTTGGEPTCEQFVHAGETCTTAQRCSQGLGCDPVDAGPDSGVEDGNAPDGASDAAVLLDAGTGAAPCDSEDAGCICR